MPRLRRADSNEPGIARRRRGRGFEYLGSDGHKVVDPELLERIRSLGIPPAWEDVWICPEPNGHLQAVGTDAAGRRQYLYHEAWRRRRDRQKFDRILEFAERLPHLRKRVRRDLRLDGMPRERVLACAARLLDLGFFRIGSEEYAEGNGSYGLATLRKDHVRVSDSHAEFDYAAKGGARRVLEVSDPLVLPVLRTLRRRRNGGPELLAYRDRRTWLDLRSSDINDYIKEHVGEEHSAKDFRTWSGTLLAAVALAANDEVGTTKTSRKRQVSEAVKVVASFLGNTPAVCRASYIDPRLIDLFLSGQTIRHALGGRHDPPAELERLHGAVERATIRMLRRGESDSRTA
ncbi:MAG TPA: DNA topoisomerase IB [Actinomycetota bacterium]|nr:DNA topoisomerase IB [Actinomycetota bacterium]